MVLVYTVSLTLMASSTCTVKERVTFATDCIIEFLDLSFPCFDQPDVKAPLKFQIVSPKEWTVISNENVELQQPY
jgi:aminopeptidase N